MPRTKYNGVPGRLAHAPLAVRAALLLLGTASALGAQRVRGPWDDATIAPRGTLRAEISTWWSQARERYGATGELESLGARLSADSLGPRHLEALGGLVTYLPQLTGGVAPALSLGTLDTEFEVSTYVTPITLEYGLTSRVALRTVIPYVKNRVEVYPRPNATGITGNLGPNPWFLVAEARTRNQQVVTEIQGATTALQTALTNCLGSTAPSCVAINADRAAAEALVQAAGAAAGATQAIYGSTTVRGAVAVPLAGSPLHGAVEARLADLSTRFATFLGAAPGGQWIAARPVAAAPLGYDGLQRMLTDTAGGVFARPLSDVEHSHLGDIELGAKIVLFDSYRHEVGRPVPPRGGLRFAVAGIYRLPTAQRDNADDFADIGTGDAQADIEGRAFLDVIAGPRFWASVAARVGLQQSDRISLRIPRSADEMFPGAYRLQDVERDLGDFFELELAPRFTPNEGLALSANYRYRQKGADTYTGTFTAPTTGIDPFAPVDFDAGLLAAGTRQSEHRLGAAITYSTVRGYAQRQSRWPLEVSLLHTRVAGGEGVMRESATAVVVRLYRRLVGPNAIRLPAR